MRATTNQHMNTEATQLLAELDQLIRSRSILQHPFYRAWQRGELTPTQLATYASVYYPHVAAFPDYLRAAIGGAADAETSATLTDNLADELTNPRPHPELWLDFAEAVGADRSAVVSAPVHPAAAETVATFTRLAQAGTGGAVATLYAYESQQPEVARQKADGLRKFYGVSNEAGLAYFEVHATADIEHSAGERAALARSVPAGSDPAAIRSAVSEALDAYWGLLDGICDVAGIDKAAA